ncbi:MULTISPECIES: primosomal protein DnaT [Tenebrionibacter/Tenebrionicola group]|jgi:DNA replication protein DnaT|uniref:Replication restart protein DnaT n=2 Tax=Tenebrionibacter/Tenebrionicola group TaxID=2969848 RepID=A0A8K0XXR8_9ENTR|nr:MULTISPECIES: primosomal protein DnaT [Tenebrionibacter/Tenebrionicola group]MBK4715652.1 primosomal protein DnaT [Tenebrionibacter intestinalis]MBV4412396.1 primosomal protein DnaT [Tenebrionicola larvae]MBV5096405.1 primosomal protein DnaT [Tenebrionicola larvae]
MSVKILSPDVTGIDAFYRDPAGVLAASATGTVAVFDNNMPTFYAITPTRLAELLALEAKQARPATDVMLEAALYHDAPSPDCAPPLGKFSMYPGWRPDDDFQRMAALWGMALKDPVTPEELASFIAYWQAEGKVFHHIQWQQKLARSVQTGRAANGGLTPRDVNALSQPDSCIPDGFRG